MGELVVKGMGSKKRWGPESHYSYDGVVSELILCRRLEASKAAGQCRCKYCK